MVSTRGDRVDLLCSMGLEQGLKDTPEQVPSGSSGTTLVLLESKCSLDLEKKPWGPT